MGITHFDKVQANLFIGSSTGTVNPFGAYLYVDGDNGNDSNLGTSPSSALKTIANAVNVAGSGDTIYIKARSMTGASTDPVSYAETVILTKTLNLIGVPANRTQGGLPQIKIGTGSTAMITVRAPGCIIANLGINGGGSTGGGILLDDDGATKSAFGTSILNCHFKNCAGSSGKAHTGGAIMWSSAGNAWQVRIAGNEFYKNVADVVLLGTGGSVPQDVVIENNVFSGPAASVDCNLYLAGGSGMNGVTINNNIFTCFPALAGGNEDTSLNLTGCVGILAGNLFASTGKTYGAAANVKVPTTVLMAGNFQEDGATQILRT